MAGKPTYEELESRISDLEKKEIKLKHVEMALRESDEKFNRFLRNAPLPYQSLDENGNFLEVNQLLQDVLGYTREELIGKNFGDFLHPDWVEHFKENFPKFRAVGEVLGVEFEMVKKDGSTLLVSFNGKIQQDNRKHFQRTHCIFQDITERRRAENSLRNSEKKYRTLFENMAQGVFYQNADGVLTDFNDTALEMFGLTPDQFVGKTSLDAQWKVICEDGTELPGDKHPSMLAMQTGKPVRDAVVGVYNPCIKSFKWLVVNAIPQFNQAGGKPYQVFVTLQDITERKRLEASLLQAQKMEAIGLMAGGVAHDLNNILTGITGYPELLLQQLPSESGLRKPIEAIRECGNRAASVVEDLLTVARGVATSKVIANMNRLVMEYFESPEAQQLRATNQHIQFEKNLTGGQLNLSCSPVHIKKSIMNLVTNAAEAIDGQGTIRLSTTTTIPSQDWAGKNRLQQMEYIVLTVEDTGTGIPPENIEHIFEPFYTKKVMGKSGTGLGLTVVWNTVEDHDGKIFVESSDDGTRFHLYLPVSSEKETVLAVAEDVATGKSGDEQILVVDDEEHLCDIASQMLENLGYTVHTVSSGEKALRFVKTNKVDLIVLDMLMDPGMNGLETYKKILKLYPEQKAVVVSGFSESEAVKATLRLGAGGYIKKPYSMDQLGQVVREVLSN